MDLSELSAAMHEFVESKGWYAPDSVHPQTSRNLAISLVIEAGEVLEQFQWEENSPDQAHLADELADVALYLLQLASINAIDLETAILEKLRRNYARDW